jgi:predicted secreted protein
VRGDVCWYWWNCWPSLNELRWEVIFVDIGGIVDHHSMSWGERWFLLIFPPISTNITSHFNSLSDGQQFHQYQKQSPLTSTHWMMVNNSTNINKNHLSLQELLTISQWVKVRGDACWYWWNCLPSLNELRWEVIFVDIGGFVDHHPMSWGERWFLLILVSTKITTHLNSLSDGQQFHQYQPKSHLTSTHWVMVNNSTNINKNHLSHQLIEWCQQFHHELRWEVIFINIGGIVDHHSMS